MGSFYSPLFWFHCGIQSKGSIYWSRLKYMDVLGPFQIVFFLDNFCNGIFNMVLFFFQLSYLVKGC